jgi:hypothetical protein
LEVETPAEVQQANTSTFGRKKQHHKMKRLGSVPNSADDVLVSKAREPRAYIYVYILKLQKHLLIYNARRGMLCTLGN